MIARHDKLTVGGILLAAVLMFALTVFAFPAKAAPHAESAEECIVVVDMAIVAAALAKNDVKRGDGDKIMADIYLQGGVDAQKKNAAFVGAVMRVAYADKPDPKTFATALYRMCMMSRGSMDGILGSDV